MMMRRGNAHVDAKDEKRRYESRRRLPRGGQGVFLQGRRDFGPRQLFKRWGKCFPHISWESQARRVGQLGAYSSRQLLNASRASSGAERCPGWPAAPRRGRPLT